MQNLKSKLTMIKRSAERAVGETHMHNFIINRLRYTTQGSFLWNSSPVNCNATVWNTNVSLGQSSSSNRTLISSDVASVSWCALKHKVELPVLCKHDLSFTSTALHRPPSWSATDYYIYLILMKSCEVVMSVFREKSYIYHEDFFTDPMYNILCLCNKNSSSMHVNLCTLKPNVRPANNLMCRKLFRMTMIGCYTQIEMSAWNTAFSCVSLSASCYSTTAPFIYHTCSLPGQRSCLWCNTKQNFPNTELHVRDVVPLINMTSKHDVLQLKRNVLLSISKGS